MHALVSLFGLLDDQEVSLLLLCCCPNIFLITQVTNCERAKLHCSPEEKKGANFFATVPLAMELRVQSYRAGLDHTAPVVERFKKVSC